MEYVGGDRMDGYRWLARRMKAMGHPIRLRILGVLESEGESCVCHLEARLGQRQATISQHLARLREAGLVNDRRDGLNVYYSLTDDSVASLLEEARKGMPNDMAVPKKAKSVDCPCPRCAEGAEIAVVALSGRAIQEGSS
jgi:DNA-binding transcriptional ArsR family regulator